MGHAGRILRKAEKLDLTAKQKDRIWTILQEQDREVWKIMEDRRDSRHTLRSTVMSNDYDPEQIEAMAEARGDAVEQMFLKRAESGHEVWETLTPDQQQQLSEMRGRYSRDHHRPDSPFKG